MGLLQLDVLGIRMQSSMAHAVDEIARVTGERIVLDDVTSTTRPPSRSIQSAQTLGCFQIESTGSAKLIGKFAPRPSATSSSTSRCSDPARWSPTLAHRSCGPTGLERAGVPARRPASALRRPARVVVFHEQVLRIVATMTGCSLAEADETRRALGSVDGQDDVRAWFYPDGDLDSGYDLPTVERVWDVLRAFASFGFCKAHAAAFALPTYQSAWLKAHHPAAFYAAHPHPRSRDVPEAADPRRRAQPGSRSSLGLDVNRSDDVYRVSR